MVNERQQVGASKPWHEVTVDGVRLCYDDQGTGPPIVCLHAIGHGARDFEEFRRRFHQRYRVIALDWPGQGRSADDKQPASAARYSQVLAGFVDALKLDRFVILGNSIGGAAAIHYTASHPGRVRGLIISNPGGLDRNDMFARPMTHIMSRFFAAGARGANWFPRAFAAYYRMVLPAAPAHEQRSRIVAAGRETATVLSQAWNSFGEPEADLRPLIPHIQCPVLFAWAARDQIVQLWRNQAAIQSFPNARLVKFAAGHSPFLETPDEFEREAEKFLAALPE